MFLTRMLVLFIGYCCGLFQTGVIIGKLVGTDLKKHGSGNIGTTNALRVLGVKSGFIVFLGDFIKCFIPCLIIHYGLVKSLGPFAVVLTVWCGLGVIIGHSYPFFMKFKGGKGVACAAALGFAFDWKMTLICIVIFGILAVLTRYVSLASIIALSSMFIIEMLFLIFKISILPEGYHIEGLLLLAAVAALIIFAHRSNIARLVSGTENKFRAHK